MPFYFKSIISTILFCLVFGQLFGQEVQITELGSDGPNSMVIEEEDLEDKQPTIDRSKRNRVHSKNDLKGFYNKKGILTVPYSYKYLQLIKLEQLLLAGNDSKKFGIISKENNIIIDIKYDQIKPASYPSEFYIARDKRVSLLLNKNGDTLIGPKYESIHTTLNSNEVVAILKEPNNSRKTFLVDTLGNILQKYDLRNIHSIRGAPKDYFYSTNHRFRRGAVKKSGEIMLPNIYKEIEYIKDNLWKVRDTLNKTGLVSNNNEEFIPIEHIYVGYSKKDDSIYRFYLHKDFKKYVTDALGEIIIEYEPHQRIYDESDYYFMITGDSKSEVKDVSGKVVIPSSTLSKKTLCTGDDKNPQIKIEGKNGKYALYSFEAKQLTDYKYDKYWICRSNGTLYQVSKNGKHGIIDRMGIEISPFIYDKTIIDENKVYGIIGDTKTLIKAL